jgi:hypothetical protein
VSLPVPLSVRLVTSRADKHVTRDLRDLQFREVAIGGWASARMSLDRPLATQPDEILYYGKVYVYDTRSAQVVWEGRLEDPGRGARGDGQIWDLAAMGPAAHVSDRTIPLIYCDRQLDAWTIENTASDRYIELSKRSDALTGRVERGAVWVQNAHGRWRYDLLKEAGMALAVVQCSWDTGVTDAGCAMRLHTEVFGSGDTVDDADTFNTGGGVLTATIGGSPSIPATHNTAVLALRRTGANLTVADDNTWGEFTSVLIRSILKDAAGNDITSGYTNGYVYPDEIVKDLLGRVLGSYDGANARIEFAPTAFNHLSYPDGVTAGKVIDDLIVSNPDFRWGAYESNAVGKHRFEWVKWPTSIRYEADVLDGFDSPGSAEGLYNAVRVRWRDASGQIRSTRRTSAVGVLTDAGLTREGQVDLGDNAGNFVDVDAVGDAFLAEHGTPYNAGRLTVARPIQDLLTGRRVMPWEIKAGELIRVRGVMPRVDALNATARDGVTVFRVWSKDYAVSDAAATLELDSYAPSTARALAGLLTDNITRRR